MKYERILLDVEAQHDFFDPGGNCYTPEARKARANLYRLFHWARQENIPVMSTVLRIRKGEQGPLSVTPHCVEETEGEWKMPGTVMATRINLGLLNTTDLPRDIFERFQQVIFEKRDTDIFAHPRAERLITELEGGTFILCGAGVAHGIVQAAVGLRNRGFSVILAEDAVVSLNHPLAEMALRRMEAKSVVFVPTREIIAPRPARVASRFRKAVSAK